MGFCSGLDSLRKQAWFYDWISYLEEAKKMAKVVIINEAALAPTS